MGWEVHVANLYTEENRPGLLDEIIESTTENGLIVHRIPIGREDDLPQDNLWDCRDGLAIRLMYHSLERIHRQYRFHVFHVFFVYPMGYVAALLAAASSVRLILSIRGNDINQHIFSPKKAAPLQIALKRADLITSVANDLLVKADTLAPVMDRSRVILNSVVPGREVVAPVNPPRLERPVIGAVGLFKHSKGLPYLLKAFQELKRERESSLLLVGAIREAESEIHKRYLSQFGEHEVCITGPVAHDSIGAYLGLMDVLVIPSVSEGCPNVLLEAMAAGRAIVATRTGAITEILGNGEYGLLIDPGDASQIKEALFYLLDHPKVAERMGKKAQERVGAFSEEREAEQWREVYETVSDSF
jgi:glycosyltransferase involved in cell wall biosynthesis